MPKRLVVGSAFLGLLVFSAACATILGIEDAECGLPGCAGFPDSGETADPCNEYCTAITANCTGTNIQYPDFNFCMNVCKTLPAGSPDDETGNTIQCRLKRAKQTFEPETVCQVAGPSGGEVCGTLCDSYCTSMLEVCTEFSNRTACLNECEGLVDLGTYNSTMQSGPEQQCRLYHVNAAASDAKTHCKHAAGASPCDAN
jgi:hypothetical protein